MNRIEKFLLEREMKKMLSQLISNIWQHPKSTIAGALLAAGQVILKGADWKTILGAAATAALAAVLQDPSKPTK